MSESAFRFQQFEVRQDRCAMKVGTDGVLLGAWAKVVEFRSILDVGTGTGLIALMVAQRNPEAKVVAVEIEADAAQQAKENVVASPFVHQITVRKADIRTFSDEGGTFDCILCNPPFFSEDTLSPVPGRSLARHSTFLSFDDLLVAVRRLLSLQGEFSVILPFQESKDFVTKALSYKLFLIRRCLVRTVPRKSPKRVLLAFSSSQGLTSTEELVLQSPDGNRSPSYAALTRDFYL